MCIGPCVKELEPSERKMTGWIEGNGKRVYIYGLRIKRGVVWGWVESTGEVEADEGYKLAKLGSKRLVLIPVLFPGAEEFVELAALQRSVPQGSLAMVELDSAKICPGLFDYANANAECNFRSGASALEKDKVELVVEKAAGAIGGGEDGRGGGKIRRFFGF